MSNKMGSGRSRKVQSRRSGDKDYKLKDANLASLSQTKQKTRNEEPPMLEEVVNKLRTPISDNTRDELLSNLLKPCATKKEIRHKFKVKGELGTRISENTRDESLKTTAHEPRSPHTKPCRSVRDDNVELRTRISENTRDESLKTTAHEPRSPHTKLCRSVRDGNKCRFGDRCWFYIKYLYITRQTSRNRDLKPIKNQLTAHTPETDNPEQISSYS